MKKLLLLTGLLAVFSCSFLKADNFYVGGFTGGNWIQDNEHHINLDYKAGYIIGGNFGYRWTCSGWRIEGEYSYRKNRIKHIKFDNISLSVHGHQRYYLGMGNLIYDFYLPNTYVTPYIGGGVGWYEQRINISQNSFNAEGTERKVGWQILAGLAYEVDSCYSVLLSYRMFKPVDKYFNHGLTLGVNYNF